MKSIKLVKGVSCVVLSHFAPSVQSVPHVVTKTSVGGRLQSFWQVWQKLGSNPRVVSLLRDGYSLPFRERPHLSRLPLVVSKYASPSKSKALVEALWSLRQKRVMERVVVKSSLAFYNRLFLVPKPNGQWRPILDLSQLNPYLSTGTFKMETPETIRLSLQQGEWVTSLDFSDAYFHIPIAQRSRKYLRFHMNKVSYHFTSLPFGLATAPLEFTKVVKEVKLMAQARGIRIHQYLDDWLLRAPSQEICLQHTRTLLDLCQGLGWLVNMQKSELVPQQVFNFVGYRFDLLTGRVLPTQDRLASLREKLRFIKGRNSCTVPSVHVPDRSSDCDGKASVCWSAPYEANSVAPEASLACAGTSGEGNSGSQVSPSSFGLVVGRQQCSSGSTFAPSSTRSSSLYRRFKRRLGRSLRRSHCKRSLVSTRRKAPHKFSGAEGGSLGPKELRASVQEPDCSNCDRQHNCSLLHKQGGRYEIRLSLCPPLETSVLVPSQGNSPAGQTYSGSLECDSRQTLQTQSSDPNRVVSRSAGIQSVVLQLGSTSGGLVRHPLQFQDPQVCVSGSGSESLGSGRSESTLGGSGGVCLSPGLPAQPSGLQGGGSGLSQNDSDSSRMAQHALVLGPGESIRSGSLPASSAPESDYSAVQRTDTQEPQQLESSCLAPRSCVIQEQGFTDEVAARIEAPQRRSTRAVYKSKWTIFVKWCDSNQVDFRSPSLSQITDFLLYLFKDRNLQPSTINGYRTAIADMVGNDKLNISKDENLTRLLDSFHRDKPKGRRGIPSWNLSLVLHQLTKAPFEPLRKASLKHLTFKTVFLLALGSGKRRSEIHAWLFRNIRHQENWTQVSMYPSPSFISKNQLAKEAPASIAPVVIPALSTYLDRSLKEDRSLCPVRALRYYLDRTKDSREGKELVFVSFRPSFQKDIVPATISSWIKQTVILCYQLSDEEAQTLHQVKAHDVRAFAASRAFQGGISLDQILSACHWKAHNTFTQFYLKDLAWADSERFHLGPIVAAQQVHND